MTRCTDHGDYSEQRYESAMIHRGTRREKTINTNMKLIAQLYLHLTEINLLHNLTSDILVLTYNNHKSTPDTGRYV